MINFALYAPVIDYQYYHYQYAIAKPKTNVKQNHK
jgi:hypothetical protein